MLSGLGGLSSFADTILTISTVSLLLHILYVWPSIIGPWPILVGQKTILTYHLCGGIQLYLAEFFAIPGPRTGGCNFLLAFAPIDERGGRSKDE